MDKILNNLYYQMISKRKSFHTFTGKNKLSDFELNEISEKIKTFKFGIVCFSHSVPTNSDIF